MGIVGRRTASSIFYGMVGKITSTLIAFAGSVVLARILGPDYYGLAYALIALPQALVGFVDLGLNGIITRYGSRNEWDTAIAAAFLRLLLVIAMTVAFLLLSKYIAYVFNRPYIIKYMPIVTLYFFVYSLAMMMEAIVGALGLFHMTNAALIARTAVRVSFAIVLALLGFGAISVVWGLVIGYSFESGVLTLIAIYKLRHYIINAFHNLQRLIQGIRESIRMIAPLIVNIIVSSVTSPVISTLQIRYASNELLGNFNVSSNIGAILDGIAGVISGGFTFGITASKDPEIIHKSFIKGSMYVTLILSFFVVGTIVFANQIVAILYGGAYRYAGLMLMLQASTLFSVVLGQYGAFLWAVGDTRLIGLLNVINALVSLGVAVVLIMEFGGVWGSIYMFIISAYSGGLISLILTYKVHRALPDLKSNLRALAPSLLSGIIIYPFTLFLTPKISLLLVIPYTLLFALFTALFLRTKEINELIRVAAADRMLSLILRKPLLLILRINTYLYNMSWLQKTLYYDE
ncbi:MAG: oligosaccharide flippase family protein [Vulcanisaeta sp.]